MIGNQVVEDLRRCCEALEADNKRLRFALGDNGQRSVPELIAYARTLAPIREST